MRKAELSQEQIIANKQILTHFLNYYWIFENFQKKWSKNILANNTDD